MMEARGKTYSSGTTKEEIYAFAKEGELPLSILMAGITNPDPAYRIERSRERSRLFVFEYVIAGRGRLLIDGERFDLTAGDTYILTPDTEQCYYSDKSDPLKKIWVNLESTYLSTLLEAHGLCCGVYRYNAYARLEEIFTIAKSGRSVAAVSQQIAPILLSLIEALSGRYEQKKENGTAQIARTRIDALNGKAFSPSALAEELHVSLSTLTRDFLSAYGATPYEYYLSHKEMLAKSLLQNTALSAKEIAYRLGFADEHYFSNFFKKRTGLRPMEYKKGCFFGP